MILKHNRRCAAAFALTLAFSSVSQGDTYYSIVDLGNLSGPLSSAANISNSGGIAGLSMLANGNYHAVLWNAGPADLGTLGVDTQSSAFAVNDVGQVVGVSYNYGDLSPHAFRWQSGALTSIGNFSPHDINSTGIVAGHVTVFNSANLWVDHPCMWTSGTLTELPTLGGYDGQVLAINGAGVCAGQSHLANNATVRGCVWINGVAHDLGTLAGAATSKSAAMDVNDNGQVVGWSDTASGQPHACLFTIDANGNVTQRTDLGLLGSNNSFGYGLNNGGNVVGVSDGHGFVWQAGSIVDINARIASSSGWTVTKGSAINDSGVIVGEATKYGFGHAVKLIPSDCLKGDTNIDGSVDGLDIDSFLEVMLHGGSAQQTCSGDVSAPTDGMVTPADIAIFVQCVLNGGCQ